MNNKFLLKSVLLAILGLTISMNGWAQKPTPKPAPKPAPKPRTNVPVQGASAGSSTSVNVGAQKINVKNIRILSGVGKLGSATNSIRQKSVPKTPNRRSIFVCDICIYCTLVIPMVLLKAPYSLRFIPKTDTIIPCKPV